MNKRTQFFLLLLTVILAATSVEASGVIGYHARLSRQDHYNAEGRRLHSVAAILAQDRANYHRFRKRDPSDQSDPFFTTEAHRALFYEMKIIYQNFGDHPTDSIINEYLDVDVKIIGLTVYVKVSAG